MGLLWIFLRNTTARIFEMWFKRGYDNVYCVRDNHPPAAYHSFLSFFSLQLNFCQIFFRRFGNLVHTLDMITLMCLSIGTPKNN